MLDVLNVNGCHCAIRKLIIYLYCGAQQRTKTKKNNPISYPPALALQVKRKFSCCCCFFLFVGKCSNVNALLFWDWCIFILKLAFFFFFWSFWMAVVQFFKGWRHLQALKNILESMYQTFWIY
jgi:hypothetical protein